MKDECMICGAPLVYLEKDEATVCAVCGKAGQTKTKCEKGHYVCDECHTNGVDAIVGVCASSESRDPVEIFRTLIKMPFCHTHGPEHHIMVAAALITAYKNAGGEVDLDSALKEAVSRGKSVPGGICGFWGSCGAGIGAGIFVSVVTGATPLSENPWGLANRMTAAALERIGAVGGPRCCKRNSYIALETAVTFAERELGVKMTGSSVKCDTFTENNQCIGVRCPFSPKKQI